MDLGPLAKNDLEFSFTTLISPIGCRKNSNANGLGEGWAVIRPPDFMKPKNFRRSVAPGKDGGRSRIKASSPEPRSQPDSGDPIDAGIQAKAVPPGHHWTFLTNHSHVLVLLSRNPSLVLREVALRVGITERAVQRIIADLESGGVIEREKVGRQNHYRICLDQPLRHPIEAHRTIGDLLELLNGKQG